MVTSLYPINSLKAMTNKKELNVHVIFFSTLQHKLENTITLGTKGGQARVPRCTTDLSSLLGQGVDCGAVKGLAQFVNGNSCMPLINPCVSGTCDGQIS